MQRQTAFTLATYGSPLRRPGTGWLLTVLLLALLGFALWGFSGIFADLDGPKLRVLLQALAVTGAISLVPIALLRWLDRREPEPWFMYAVAFLWGGIIAAGVASDLNTRLAAVTGAFLESVAGAPFIEEGAKGLGLLVLLLALRGEFDGPRDGFLYGALIGLGFNWLESSVYLTNSFVATGVTDWGTQLSSRYALLGLSGHALYTGITGTFVGFALLSNSWFRQAWMTLLGFLLAALSHVAWNALGIFVSGAIAGLIGVTALGQDGFLAAMRGGTTIPFWANWPGTVGAVLLVNLFSLVIVLVGLRRSGRWEKTTMVTQLADEVDRPAGAAVPVVTDAEYAAIKGRCEPPKARLGHARFAAQCNLAKRKAYLAQRHQPVAGDPVVDAWRAEAQTLRPATA